MPRRTVLPSESMTTREQVTLLDGAIRFLADGRQTEGRMLLTEQIFPPTEGPPFHTHPMTEVFHVIEGVVEVLLWPEEADRPDVYRLETGETHLVPFMAVHTFRPVGSPINRLVAAFTPVGTGEDFFLDAGEAQEGPFRLPEDPDLSQAALDRVTGKMEAHEFLIAHRQTAS